MADLSDTSQEWWELMLKHTKSWYDKYMTEPPMQRLLLTPTAPLEVSNGKWRRVERRAVTLLMKALPDQVKEELIATKSLDVFSLVCRLMLLYQRGGVAERSSILKNLEQPQEAATIQAAVQGLRRWLRWKRRAEEIGVSLPDPSVLSRGLHRLTKKVLEGNKDLSFNISLARSTLQVDTVPNYGTISTYCEHLLSELEQLVHTEKKTVKALDYDGKIKKFEGVGQASGGGGGKGWEGRSPKKEGDVRERKPSRYYLTDAGCRRGRQCTFSHEAKDEKNRCYECGAVDHYRKDCPRKQQDKEGGNRTEKSPSKIAKVTEVDDEQSSHQGDQAESSGATSSTSTGNAKNAKDAKEGDALQSVLEEAGKMLRSLNIKAATSTGRDDRDVRLNDLQKQLDQMKRLRALRFVKVSKIDYLPEYGLLDSGATHAMRGVCGAHDWQSLEEIQVELALLRMTAGKVIVHEDDRVQPIVPLGMLVEKLGCEVRWSKKGACKLRHAVMGEIQVRMNAGCPEVEKEVALTLINALEELEVRENATVKKINEESLVVNLARDEEVFQGVPVEIMEKVVVRPAKDLSGIPLNRSRRRKLLDGFVLHLYAGEDDGYTLGRALKEVGGDKTRLVEIDVKRGPRHDMMEDDLYASLMHAAMSGLILGVVGGPNCRTRSVLRHGLPNLDPEEKTQVWEDDVLLYRMVMIFCAAEEGRKRCASCSSEKKRVAFLLEQPEAPDYVPECGSWWRIDSYNRLKDDHGLMEYRFRQGDYGGAAVKPTMVATNLHLEMPTARSTTARTRSEAPVKSSTDLSRWAPGMMREVARAMQEEVFGKPARNCKLSWREHLLHGHTPFRRDCRVCQEASARGRRHCKIAYPEAAVLSLDLSGPFRPGKDINDATVSYFLIGTYTWPVEEEPGKPFPEEEKDKEVKEEDLPVIEEGIQEEERAEEPDRGEPDQRDDRGEGKGDEEIAREECGEPRPLKVIVKVIPLPNKKAKTVLEGIQDIYIQLKRQGYPVQRLHTDRGKEFLNHDLRSWCLVREVATTTTSADSPQENGRAEACIASLKSKVRRLLRGAEMDVKFWPMAARYAVEAEKKRTKGEKMVAAFGEEVWVPKRSWKKLSDPFGPTHEKARYLAEVPEVTKGHGILRQDGKVEVVSKVITGVREPRDEEQVDAIDDHRVRRRIRGKRAAEERDEDRRRLEALRQVIYEEQLAVEKDEGEVLGVTAVKVRELQKEEEMLIEELPSAEERQVLQTRMVGQAEVMKNREEWLPAIKAEMQSLLEEKKAVRIVSQGEAKAMMEDPKIKVEVMPGKMVTTIKAPAGKKKCRLVICGNYAEWW